jgi:hypothetical protein
LVVILDPDWQSTLAKLLQPKAHGNPQEAYNYMASQVQLGHRNKPYSIKMWTMVTVKNMSNMMFYKILTSSYNIPIFSRCKSGNPTHFCILIIFNRIRFPCEYNFRETDPCIWI